MDVERVIDNATAEAARRPTLEEGHPSEAQLWAYVNDDLDADGRHRIGAHLGSCPQCRSELTSLREALHELDALLSRHLSAATIEEGRPASEHNGLMERIERIVQNIVGPRRWAWHAAAFVVGSTTLVGLNSYLHASFTPEPSPFGSPPPAPWWAEWWVPYVVGAWGGLLVVHGLVVWRQRRRNNGTPNSDTLDDD